MPEKTAQEIEAEAIAMMDRIRVFQTAIRDNIEAEIVPLLPEGFQYVKSSALRAFKIVRNDADQFVDFHVIFPAGTRAHYSQVPVGVAEGFLHAVDHGLTMGKFFSAEIRGKFPFAYHHTITGERIDVKALAGNLDGRPH